MVWQQSACVTCGHPGVRGVHQVFGSSTVIQVEATANFASFFFSILIVFHFMLSDGGHMVWINGTIGQCVLFG